MKSLFIPTMCFALILVSSCEKSGEFTNTIDTIGLLNSITLPTAVTNLDNDLILKFVNAKRNAGCNCGTTVMPPVAALTWNNALAVVASRHSADMLINNFLSHISSNGATLANRIALSGYKWSALGENVASGTFTEQSVVDAWIASPGHCTNLMSADFTEVGLARAGMFWTQNFGKAQQN